MKDRLDENRRILFRLTCFGPWLDLSYVENEESLVHYMLQKQMNSDDHHYDLPLIYKVNGHLLHFRRRQFNLITGFEFGMPSIRKKVGEHVKSIDLLSLIEDEELFTKL